MLFGNNSSMTLSCHALLEILGIYLQHISHISQAINLPFTKNNGHIIDYNAMVCSMAYCSGIRFLLLTSHDLLGIMVERRDGGM